MCKQKKICMCKKKCMCKKTNVCAKKKIKTLRKILYVQKKWNKLTELTPSKNWNFQPSVFKLESRRRKQRWYSIYLYPFRTSLQPCYNHAYPDPIQNSPLEERIAKLHSGNFTRKQADALIHEEMMLLLQPNYGRLRFKRGPCDIRDREILDLVGVLFLSENKHVINARFVRWWTSNAIVVKSNHKIPTRTQQHKIWFAIVCYDRPTVPGAKGRH
jgi:hypothetical protein